MSNSILDTFENPNVGREYEVNFNIPEFTCLCPLTGQPDFAHFYITYIPDKLCIELKSLKLYFFSFRDKSGFHEAITNQVLNDLISKIDPIYMQITGEFFVRGGISTTVVVEHNK